LTGLNSTIASNISQKIQKYSKLNVEEQAFESNRRKREIECHLENNILYDEKKVKDSINL